FERRPPHNPFGVRLKELGRELKAAGKSWDLPARLRAAAAEDSDGDGVPNEIEILSGHAPGDPRDVPSAEEIKAAEAARRAFEAPRDAYDWQPFRPVERPAVPEVRHPEWVRNPIDAFIVRDLEAHGLTPRPEAPRHVLLRRLYLDLLGLPPRPAEMRAF